MANLLLLACAAVAMVQVFPGTDSARVVKVTETFKYKFAIDHALVMSYTDPSQRDALLQQIFTLWKTILAQYQVTNPTIHFQQEASALDPNSHVVQYRISGGSQQEVHLKDVTDAFEQALPGSGIQAQTLASLGIPVNTVTINGGDNGNQGNTNGQQQGQQGSQLFQVDNNVLLTYTTQDNLNQLLQQILNLWETTFGSTYQLTNLKITSLTSRPNGKGSRAVTYRIIGQSNTPINVQQTITQFQPKLQQANLPGVQVVNIGGNTAGNGMGMSSNMQSNNGGAGGGAAFQLDDSAVLTYDTPADRDAILQKLLSLFITTFSSAQLNSVTIVFINEQPGNVGSNSHVVKFRITGQNGGPDAVAPLDQTSTQNTFDSAITSAVSSGTIPGLVAVNTDDDISLNDNNGGGAPFTIDDSVLLTYTSNSQRDALLQRLLKLFQTTYSSYQLTNVKIVLVNSNPAPGGAKQVSYRITGNTAQTPLNSADAVKGIHDAITNGIQQGTLSGIDLVSQGTKSGTQPFEINDNLLITYTSTQQRDQLLQTILNLFTTTFSSYQFSNTKITYKKDTAGPGASRTVYFKISGQAGQQVDVPSTISQFHTAVQNANINGGTVAVPGSTPTGTPIDITDSIVITANTRQKRDSLLQQIFALWKTVLSQYQASNLQISAVTDVAATPPTTSSGVSARLVKYHITGSSLIQFNSVDALIALFRKALQQSPIQNVFLVSDYTAASGATTESSAGSGNVGAMAGGNGGPFSIPGSVKLTYQNTQDRDTFLNQILVMWRTSIFPYQVENVAIRLTGESGTAPTKTVSYVVTGISALPIDMNEAQTTFTQTLQDSHLIGVTI